jgi:hypothetical protein
MAIDDFSLERGGAPSANTRGVKIPQYQQRTAASGMINSRAANVQIADGSGQALQNIGAQMGRIADYEIEQEKQSQRLAANTAYAQDAGSLGVLYDQHNQAMPAGGKGFMKTIVDATDEFISKAVKDKPEFYRQEYERHMRLRQSNLVQNAQVAEIQEGARYKLESINTDVQATVNNLSKNPSTEAYNAELKRLTDVIDSDPSLRVDVKAKAKDAIKQQLAYATSVRIAEEHAKAVPVGGAPASGAYGSTQLANAIYGQESGGGKADTSKVNSQNVTGPMQMQEATFNGMKKQGLIPADYDWKNPAQNKEAGFKWVDYLYKKYDGNAEKVAAAYYGGEGAVNADGSINKQWRNKQRPNDPTVGEYVDQVLARVGKAGQAGGYVAKEKPSQQVSLSEIIGPAFDALPFEQQQRVQAHYDSQFKQQQASKTAGIAIESAASVVGAAPLSAESSLDIPALKAQAVAIAEERLGQKLDAQQRLNVENNVEKQASDKERDFKRSVGNDMAAGFDILRKNGGDYQALLRDNPALVQRVGPEKAAELNRFAGQEATGGNRDTDWQAYNDLLNDPKTLAATNLDSLASKFNSKELAQLQKLQQHLRTTPQAEDNILGDKALVGSMLKSAGVTDDKKEAQFYSLLQQAIDQELAATGKKALTQERKKELAADLLVQEVTSKGVLWDSNEKAFLVQIPPQEKVKIQAALQEAGMPVNDYNVLRAYRNKLNKKPVLAQQQNSPLVKQIPQ